MTALKVDLFMHLLELLAAVSASYYWLKTRDEGIRPFVWYLWFIVFIETVAMYPYLYEYMSHDLQNWFYDSKICRNSWLYNFYDPIVVFLLGKFIILNTKLKRTHLAIRGLSFGFLFFAIIYYVFENDFFATNMEFPMLVSALVIIVMVAFYLLEMLKSERIIDLKKSHVFLLLIALAIWYTCVSPLFIFNNYYNTAYPRFVEFRFGLLVILNNILYTYYILVFIFTLRNKVLELKAEKS